MFESEQLIIKEKERKDLSGKCECMHPNIPSAKV